MACLWAGISKIVYGAGRDDVHQVYFESRHNNTFDFIRDAFRNDLFSLKAAYWPRSAPNSTPNRTNPYPIRIPHTSRRSLQNDTLHLMLLHL